jgi:hypothetical protein
MRFRQSARVREEITFISPDAGSGDACSLRTPKRALFGLRLTEFTLSESKFGSWRKALLLRHWREGSTIRERNKSIPRVRRASKTGVNVQSCAEINT